MDKCRVVARSHKVVDRYGKIQQAETLERGFKLIVAYWCKGRIPLAAKVVRINEHESKYAMDLVRQAQSNIGVHASIACVLLDRGFIDGTTLHDIGELGIEYIIPAKDNMRVYEDARCLARTGHGNVSVRTQTVLNGYGKHRVATERVTEVVGIEGLRSYDQYVPQCQLNFINRKDHNPKSPSMQWSCANGTAWTSACQVR